MRKSVLISTDQEIIKPARKVDLDLGNHKCLELKLKKKLFNPFRKSKIS